MTNATMKTFGFPDTLVRPYDHWAVLVRPAQVTLGSLVLVSTSEATAFGDLPPGAYPELGRAVPAIEAALRAFVDFEKINYLMLMMVDPHVHLHVLPRYSGSRVWHGLNLPDGGWPGPPDLKSATAIDPGEQALLRDEIAKHFG
ncbi:MAG TPA: HIT family protein [Sphingomicrobium sp.]|nr:HIT family protein [Sphingomicrobium sp.]